VVAAIDELAQGIPTEGRVGHREVGFALHNGLRQRPSACLKSADNGLMHGSNEPRFSSVAVQKSASFLPRGRHADF
jgi:hypothetical protein